MSKIERPKRYKYSTPELMELIDLFGVSESGQAGIKGILDKESTPPDAFLFRYYNDKSKVVQLEEEFAAYMNTRHALAVNSGTSALIAALLAVGVAPGDEVIVPGYTFFASASAIVVARGIPVITEIDESLTLDPAAVEAAVTDRTKAILVVHMSGFPAKMDAICDIAKRHNLYVIEDVAQACGGKYQGKHLGTWGEMGCTSFDAFKVMGTGEGGMITTDDDWLYTRAQSYHDTAACWRPDRYARERKTGELFCGENYRMSEMAGAIGLAQIRRMAEINETTLRIHNQLREEISLPAGAKWLPLNDPEGLCGYKLGILFDDPAVAKRAWKADIGVEGLGSGSTGVRDWHAYWYWEHVLEQKTVTPEGFPFRSPYVEQLPDYSENMCPRTRDILTRVGFLWIDPTDTPEWASAHAKEMTEKLKAVVEG